MNEEILTLKGRVRIITCDGAKYPTLKDVDRAIANGEADIGEWKDNLIPLVGRAAIVRRLGNSGTYNYEGMITYCAIGNGIAAPSSADTGLSNEFFRNAVATYAFNNNILTVRMFMTTTEGNTTITEYGLFGENASATPGSGTLFEKVALSKTKTSSMSVTIESQITIN